ncbi:MAG: S-layer homology domain-containing protein [Peptococcaceae bacterium]|nr:S-layer homology domain-containing protein [Peptococcaceae bacterium]
MLTKLLTGRALAGRPAVLAAVVAAALLLVFPRSAPAEIQTERVLESRPVAEGLVLEKRAVTINDGQVLIYTLRADLTNPYLRINTLVGAGGTLDKNARVTDMAQSAGAVAAVNADFFQMNESGRPIGMTYKDGRLVTSPPLRNDMPGWAITGSGVPLIEVFGFSGKVTAGNGAQFPLSGINKPSYIESGEKNSHENSLLVYDRFWGESSRGKIDSQDSVTEVFVNNGTVAEILVNQPGKAIPRNGFVLAGRGTAADFIKANIKVGDKITLDYRVVPEGDKIWAGTGGWSLLVDGGRAMGSFPASINGYNARTAIGYSKDKKTLFVVAVEKSAASRGVTLNELAEYMAGLKVDRALNLDGGGSTTLAARPLGEDKPVLVNRPQRETERLVPTAIGFFSTAPRGSLAGLVVRCPDQIFPGDSVRVEVKGYDSHFNPFPLDRENVRLSVDSGPGSINNGFFTAANPGLTAISAVAGGMRAAKTVRVLGSGDLMKIAVDPSSIAVKPGGTVELKVSAVDRYGTVYTLTPKNYSAAVDPGLGRLENGIFRAADTPAAGRIKITLGDYSAAVPVTVKPEDQAACQFVPGQPGSVTLGDFSLSFGGRAFSGPVTVSAAYGGELFRPIPDGCKSLSAVTLQVSGEAAPAGFGEPAALTWKFQPGEGGRVAVLQFLGGGWQEIPSRVNDQENLAVCRIWEPGPLALVRDSRTPAAFSDLAGHWAAGPVSRLAAAGVVSGYPGNKFDPARKISRAEFVVMLCRALGWQPGQGEGRFRDAGSIPDWSRGYVLAAVKRGVVSGYEDGTFRPSNQVTRSEMAVMIGRALSLPPGDKVRLAEVFTDGGNVPAWAKDPVAAVYAAGIMKGDSNKKFRPGDGATRAESAALADSMLNYLLTER